MNNPTLKQWSAAAAERTRLIRIKAVPICGHGIMKAEQLAAFLRELDALALLFERMRCMPGVRAALESAKLVGEDPDELKDAGTLF